MKIPNNKVTNEHVSEIIDALEATLGDYKRGKHSTMSGDCHLCIVCTSDDTGFRDCTLCPWMWFMGKQCFVHYNEIAPVEGIDALSQFQDCSRPDLIVVRINQIAEWIDELEEQIDRGDKSRQKGCQMSMLINEYQRTVGEVKSSLQALQDHFDHIQDCYSHGNRNADKELTLLAEDLDSLVRKAVNRVTSGTLVPAGTLIVQEVPE